MPNLNAYNTVSITGTAGILIAANPNRKGLLVRNNGTQIVYLGYDSSVTSSNGFPLSPQDTIETSNLLAGYRGVLYAISASGTQDIRYMEWQQ